MRVLADQAQCCGSGQCVLAAPDVFRQSHGDGLVRLITHNPPLHHHSGVREAALTCPSGAITVDEG
ncbi:ferredoxin [Streptomyces sp. NPDC048248]|uniref:ferredoxin n=1 Tax=Streptomyces sp. NPDC048248 TaxID=3365523 RepID=UPI00371FE16A